MPSPPARSPESDVPHLRIFHDTVQTGAGLLPVHGGTMMLVGRPITESKSTADADLKLAILESIAQNEPASATLAKIGRFAAPNQADWFALHTQRDEGLLLEAANGLPEDVAQQLNAVQDLTTLASFGLTTRPLISGAAEILGALTVPKQPDRTLSVDQEQRLNEAARLAVIALEQRNLIQELTYRAHHDSLTNLKNRLALERDIEQLARCSRRFLASFLYIGLDRFRVVNDVLGPYAGDQILKLAAQRIRRGVRSQDHVARLGGDEFVVVIPDMRPDDAATTAARLLSALAEPFTVDESEIIVTASIGIAAGDCRASLPDELQRRAYLAMLAAKRSGSNQVKAFEPAMEKNRPESLEMERRLRGAMENQEMLLHFQPQVCLRTGRLMGAEALLRWNHAGVGLVSPGKFIPIAERTGLINAFGEFALLEGCLQARRWNQTLGPIRMGINVSPLQFSQETFVTTVTAALEKSGLPPHCLDLEITESAVMDDQNLAVQRILQLRELGVRFSIDDFGTGHSSLAYLSVLPANTLKIDQAFVREIRHPDDRPPLVESIIRMAHQLSISVIAEGIETPAQDEVLKLMGCEEGQGYLYSKPMPPDAFAAWARTSGRLN
jgi:diguanylate cyclase (GGDEF)-like protein